jgi:hypothetical protein
MKKKSDKDDSIAQFKAANRPSAKRRLSQEKKMGGGLSSGNQQSSSSRSVAGATRVNSEPLKIETSINKEAKVAKKVENPPDDDDGIYFLE